MVTTTTAPAESGSSSQAQSLLTNIKSTADSMEKGDVLGSAMGVTKVAMDVIGLTGDPMSAISSAGVGWVLGAVSFLKEPFEVLKGDPGAITGSAQSWNTACSGLANTANTYRSATTAQTKAWNGDAGDGYRRAGNQQADGLEALAQASRTVSNAISTAGQAVAQARKSVMDLISEAVQKIIQICIEALSKSWLSFGASVAMGIAQSVQKAVQTGQKLVQEIQKVIQTLQKIIKTVQQVVQIVQQVKQLLETIGGKASEQRTSAQTAQQVNYNANTQGLDPNNLGVHRTTAQQIAPGFQFQPVRNVAENGVQVAQAQTQQGPVSQNGWSVNPPRGTRTVPGTDVRLNVAEGPAGDVLIHVASQIHARVEDITLNEEGTGARDEWGYAERNVRGSEAVSNHASATAIDLNATRHVLGARDTFTPTQVNEIHTILREVDNVVRWGGDYTGRRDEMHFEIVGSQEEVARVAERLRQAQQPQQ